MIPSALASASYGLQQNLQQFAWAANRIAHPEAVAGITEIVAMKQAEQGAKVNAAVLRTANEMSGQLLDILV